MLGERRQCRRGSNEQSADEQCESGHESSWFDFQPGWLRGAATASAGGAISPARASDLSLWQSTRGSDGRAGPSGATVSDRESVHPQVRGLRTGRRRRCPLPPRGGPRGQPRRASSRKRAGRGGLLGIAAPPSQDPARCPSCRARSDRPRQHRAPRSRRGRSVPDRSDRGDLLRRPLPERGRAACACGLLVVSFIPLAAIEPGQPVAFTDFAFFTVFFAGPFLGGRIIRARRERERHLEGETEALRADRDERARRAVAEERGRIAREAARRRRARDQA